MIYRHDIKENNQSLLLHFIWEEKKITRAALSRKLSLSPPSVSSNIEQLIEKEIIIEEEYEESENKAGRKGKLIKLNKEFSYIISLDLSGRQLKVGICNICGEIICYEILDIIEDNHADEILVKLVNSLNYIMQKCCIARNKIGVIVVASPGVINTASGEMNFVPQFEDWDDVNVKLHLENEFSSCVILQNDINVKTIGELKYGAGRNDEHFVYINIDLGVGSGVVLSKKLHLGHAYAGGEIGFMKTDKSQLNSISKAGSLESSISIPAIRSRIAARLGFQKSDVTINLINDLYKKKDTIVLDEIDNLSKDLAMAIININAILDVESIIIGGAIKQFEVNLLERLSAYIKDSTPYIPVIKFGECEDDACIKGAYVIGTEALLKKVVQ